MSSILSFYNGGFSFYTVRTYYPKCILSDIRLGTSQCVYFLFEGVYHVLCYGELLFPVIIQFFINRSEKSPLVKKSSKFMLEILEQAYTKSS